MDNLVDDRFTGRKHFWSAAVVDRPKNKKKFAENIEAYASQKATFLKKRLSISKLN
jgi:hypothetical protein